MSPHGLRVVVVVVVVVVVGRRVVVVVGRAVVVVVTSDVVVAVVSVVVVVVLDDVDVVVVRPDELVLDDVVPVAVIVRFGCSLRLTTTMSPPVGSRPRGDWAVLPCAANRAATAAPIKAPKANRPEPPNAVSIPNDYRPHSIGSNPHGQLVPA